MPYAPKWEQQERERERVRERIETKGLGQEERETCLGSG
jgi:hypothetical protein